MITPDNQIPLDDTDNNDKEDQVSQQDIHSNGFDEENKPVEDDGSSDADRLQQASDASEPSFTLDADDE
ncbi:MAG TPA: hypothetical protein VGC01_09760 [Mucilaginibacter sp.]